MTDLQEALNTTSIPEPEFSGPNLENNTKVNLSNPGELNPTTNQTSSVVETSTINTSSEVISKPNDTNQVNQINNFNTINKDKLEQLLKSERIKGKRKGFGRGVLLGIFLAICLAIVSVIYAKDQIINFLSSDMLDFSNLKTNIMNIIDNKSTNNNLNVLDDDIDNPDDDIDNPDDDIDDPDDDILNQEENTEESSTDNSDTEDNDITDPDVEDAAIENPDDDTSTDNSDIEDNNITDSNLKNTTIGNTIIEYPYDGNFEDEELSDAEENISDIDEPDIIKEGYTIRYVNYPEDANWVMPAHCSDLECYGNDKEFSPCVTFRLSENLDENANRIGNNGMCRYKDVSELVYVEFK